MACETKLSFSAADRNSLDHDESCKNNAKHSFVPADKKFCEKVVKKLLNQSVLKKIPYESDSTNIKSSYSESGEDCIIVLSDFFSKLTVNDNVENSKKLQESSCVEDIGFKSLVLDPISEYSSNPPSEIDFYAGGDPVSCKSNSCQANISSPLKQNIANSESLDTKLNTEVFQVPVLNKTTSVTANENEKKFLQSECDVQTTLNTKETASNKKLEKYYGVSLPSSICFEADEPLVYKDKKDALNAIKVYKGARFKEFSNKTDAEEFAKQPADLIAESPAPMKNCEISANLENQSSFRKPTSQQTVAVRKAIEKGDFIKFTEAIWLNPMYLISSADSPTIMQEGSRYNALHVAAKYNQPKMCQEILNTVENPEFFKCLYPEDTAAVRESRIQHITDLYLNSVDKALLETPLHIASKFGFLQVVKVLLSHSLCDKSKRNKFGNLALELVCSRCSSNCSELAQKIKEAFDGEFYIPVLRNDTNVVQPIIGKPCTIEKVKNKSSFVPKPDIRDPEYSIKAYAGPMSPSAAKTFYHLWKHPSSPLSSSYSPDLLKSANDIRFTDMEKGLERVGRKLAFDMNIEWEEWWPALNASVDLTTTKGLDMLESYLKQYLDLKNVNNFWKTKEDFITPPSSPPKSQDFFDVPNYYTPPSSPELSDEDSSDEEIQSLQFTKDDINMFRAVEHVKIDPVNYPRINKWKKQILKNLNILDKPFSNKKILCASPVSSFSAGDTFKKNVRRPLF